MTPGEPDIPAAPATAPENPPPSSPEYRWYHKIYGVVFVTFCLEIGLFLLVFPWTDYWDNNYLSSLLPALHGFWDNPYFRGGVSGLGVVNLCIAFGEAYRLRRFSRRYSGSETHTSVTG